MCNGTSLQAAAAILVVPRVELILGHGRRFPEVPWLTYGEGYLQE